MEFRDLALRRGARGVAFAWPRHDVKNPRTGRAGTLGPTPEADDEGLGWSGPEPGRARADVGAPQQRCAVVPRSRAVTDSDLCVKVGDPRVSPKAESEAISDASSVFGANEWLVDELYEQYLQDKNAVDPAWWDFFEDYRPAERSDADTTSDAPAAPANGSVPA
ncbi:2-oxoglutarate dehydrogenase E1 subunit family protein, partial [Cellulosimicrobium cellulans]|uniref:2-oxoglutarate dehydrogenase E1 subunit family protein n=1 Tax=Cellulosimicrobium cellulans TaxID=1710 RepID=UPI0029E82960